MKFGLVPIWGRCRSLRRKALRTSPEVPAGMGSLYPSLRIHPLLPSFKDPRLDSHVEGRRQESASQTFGRRPHMRSLPPTGRERYCRRRCQRRAPLANFLLLSTQRLSARRKASLPSWGLQSNGKDSNGSADSTL